MLRNRTHDLLFRWSIGLTADEPDWDASTFSENRERLLGGPGFFLFQSIKAPMISALTDDPLGEKVPPQAAPWRRDDRDIIDVGPAETPEFIASEVERLGYHLVLTARCLRAQNLRASVRAADPS